MINAMVWILSAAAWLVTPITEPAQLTTVVLVRHAEKVDASTDPSLSEAGRGRAEELARTLAGTPIDAIFTTQYKRTQETALPLARVSGVKPVVIDAGRTYAADLAQRIRSQHRGQTVVVVGHSNSTVELLEAFGFRVAKIPDTQYDDLFVVTLGEDTGRLLILRYGATTR